MKEVLQKALAKVSEALAVRQLNEYEVAALTDLKRKLESALEVWSGE